MNDQETFADVILRVKNNKEQRAAEARKKAEEARKKEDDAREARLSLIKECVANADAKGLDLVRIKAKYITEPSDLHYLRKFADVTHIYTDNDEQIYEIKW
jgi:hypothetical protein